VLLRPIDLMAASGKYGAQGIDGNRATQSHQDDCHKQCQPDPVEVLLRFLRADQQKY
jgi:hypothetical protein